MLLIDPSVIKTDTDALYPEHYENLFMPIAHVESQFVSNNDEYWADDTYDEICFAKSCKDAC